MRITKKRNSDKCRKSICNSYKRIALAALIVVFIVLIGLYSATPMMIKQHLNNQVLADTGAYHGRIEKVTLELSTLSYVLHDIRVERKQSKNHSPFITIKRLSVSPNLNSALRGRLDVDADLHTAELNFIDSSQESEKQLGKGTHWLSLFRQILPTTVNTLSLRNGTIRLTNNDASPKVELVSHDINATLRNLSTAANDHQQRSATGYYRSKIEQSGQFFAKANFDPDHFDDFHLRATAKNIQLREFNDFFEAYANMDFDSGHGDLLIELSADQKNLDGYVKPFLHDIQIVSWQQDIEQQHDNPLKLLWETGLELVQNIVTTLGTDELATKIELSGSISRTEVQSWPAFAEAIKNMLLNSVKKEFDITGASDE